MGLQFDSKKALSLYGKKVGNLELCLERLKTEDSITDIQSASYLLATFFAESSYRNYIFESYWLCKKGETPSTATMTNSASFVKWAQGKTNYKGGRYSNGVPMYIGRGFIQITHDYNYKNYEQKCNIVGLLANPELALEFENAWKIACEYFKARKTFDLAKKGDLVGARKTVNGGTNGIDHVNSEYNKWCNILKQCV